MGYTTDFEGDFSITPALNKEQMDYINTFSATRRMKRDVQKLQETHKGEHGLNGDYGVEGEYFAFDDGDSGQKREESILEYNYPPDSQPGLWCQWIVSEDGTTLEWDGGEKFYEYVAWLEYLIEHFFNKWDVKLNGTVKWRGEDFEDMGIIVIADNKVTAKEVVW